MKITERFSETVLVEMLARIQWLEDNGYTIEDVKNTLEENQQRVKDGIKREKEKTMEEFKKSKFHGKLPLCKECETILMPEESKKEEWETELICSNCGYVEYLDISPMEYNVRLLERVEGKKPEFDPEETKVSVEERLKRRAICKKCSEIKEAICKSCRCSIKHRTYYKILACPLEKWDAID